MSELPHEPSMRDRSLAAIENLKTLWQSLPNERLAAARQDVANDPTIDEDFRNACLAHIDLIFQHRDKDMRRDFYRDWDRDHPND